VRVQVSIVSLHAFCAFLLDGVELVFGVSNELAVTAIQQTGRHTVGVEVVEKRKTSVRARN
jgi:hypothetical protein